MAGLSFVADACALIEFWATPTPAATMPNSYSFMHDGIVSVHPVTVWEITQKIAAGKLDWPPSRLPLASCVGAHGFDLLPFTWEDGEAANALPPFHKDPMDRILIASALRAGMTVITSDRIFPRYGVRTVW